MADRVTWFEIPAHNTARAGEFYSNVFGWNTSDMGGGSLMAVTTPSNGKGEPDEPGAINGDISPMSQGFDHPLIVITVDDIDAKIEMIKKAGGNVALPRTDIAAMNMAWAIVMDTEGNNIGILQNL